MTDKPHIDVIICTPGSGMTAGYVKSLLRTAAALSSQNISWAFTNAYSSHVADAREQTVGGDMFSSRDCVAPLNGEVSYKKLFWIDSDIEWEPEDFLRLYLSEKQIISGCYILGDDQVAVYPEYLCPPMRIMNILEKKSPFTVVGVGFGFLCISQGVFERMNRPWFSQESVARVNEETGEKEILNVLIGEDLSWCIKAGNLGIDIWVDPVVRIIHQRTIKRGWPE